MLLPPADRAAATAQRSSSTAARGGASDTGPSTSTVQPRGGGAADLLPHIKPVPVTTYVPFFNFLKKHVAKQKKIGGPTQKFRPPTRKNTRIMYNTGLFEKHININGPFISVQYENGKNTNLFY